jgi:hypothetical protein
MSSTHLGGLTGTTGPFVKTSVCLSFSNCDELRVSVKSSRADLLLRKSSSSQVMDVYCMPTVTATLLVSRLSSVIYRVEVDSRASLLANHKSSSIMEQTPMDRVASCSSCSNRSTNLAWADLMLAMVFAGSVLAMTKDDVHSDRSMDSMRRGWCTPSSSQSARAAASLSWMNWWSSCRSIAERVVCIAGIGVGSGEPYPMASNSPFQTGPLLLLCNVSHSQHMHFVFRRM